MVVYLASSLIDNLHTIKKTKKKQKKTKKNKKKQKKSLKNFFFKNNLKKRKI